MLKKKNSPGEPDIYHFPELDDLGFTSFVTGRRGGASPAPFDSLNASVSVGDTQVNVSENMAKIKKSVGLKNLWAPTQVHGNKVAVIDSAQPSSSVEADAVITCVPNLTVAVRTADCLPILLADPERKVIGAIHAGRGGTQLGIAGATIKKMVERFDCDPVNIRAGLGPCIRFCCYEVDKESAKNFHNCCGGSRKRHIDIAGANVDQLVTAGVSKEKIYDSSVCTSCENSRFFSHRADNGVTGRFLSGIALNG
ncbi:FIG00003370: Multicopper polyphenol oxidase [hydrothermal vent metagenome]|uniref:FIG00003370: Multicopper polyphenol oxidase n=1 Tax=hydrothermal vent metagenome TaxID=652676 RepID=A0A3B1BTI3_9ZZZZ